MDSKIRLLFSVLCISFVIIFGQNITDIENAKDFLEEYNRQAEIILVKASEAAWKYNTNITDHNLNMSVQADLQEAEFAKQAALNASRFAWRNFTDDNIRRQFQKILDIGTDALKNKTKLARLSQVTAEMKGIYSKGQVCEIPGESCLELEPGLTRLLSTNRDYNILALAWKKWRDESGRKMKKLYTEFVSLMNEGIRDLGIGFRDAGEYYRSWYESKDFEKDLQDLLEQVKPLYNQLHYYVRKKLGKVYGSNKFPSTGHIPAHLLGNMWSQTWNNVYELVKPYKSNISVDVTPTLKAKNYTVNQMFKTAEDFFLSLNLSRMPDSFWKNSMLEKPDDRQVVCHASAWDFGNQRDFRIKMCTDITMEDLITVHHEMGHIQYYLQYKGQPEVFRGGANPGFHEAIGDVMALSVSTPTHLHKIGLLEQEVFDNETEINYLMNQALDKIAFLPFGYLIDQWRWSVYKGNITPNNYTKSWWELRCKYQGISPPVPRTEDDFDPGSKYHVPANTPYIRYFVSFIIQFQFHKALCQAANFTGPLHLCDIYNSTQAGNKLKEVLQMGSSKPWPEVMRKMTGQDKMNASAIIEYFSPLIQWLKNQNGNNGTQWSEECPKMENDPEVARTWLDLYDMEATYVFQRQAEADWSYETNITDYNQAVSVNTSLEGSRFQKKMYKEAATFNWKNLMDVSMRRRFEKITNIGTSALEDEDQLKALSTGVSNMTSIYGKAKVRMSNGETLELEPGLTRLMSDSRNASQLAEAWKKWRDETGAKMRQMYEKFVTLSNKGVQQLGYKDTGEYWRSSYEQGDFEESMEKAYNGLKPLYQYLHAYVRKRLIQEYGSEHFPRTGHIPAHLLGNMWAQEWNNIYKITIPFKNKQTVDVTETMKKQNFTANRMFHEADEFYISLGLEKMRDEFWNKSMLEKPEGREVVCHASAWDFYNRKDFRIKMCTDITMEDLTTIHHEMGHIQYFMEYRNQPMPFRDGANPGFHEAIGDVMALSVATPSHLLKIRLLDKVTDDLDSDINFLFNMALEKIAFLPFGLLIDKWRWDVFSGKTTPASYNADWWKLRCKYQGVSPPVSRSEADFDPGAKFHVPSNYPYIRYFVARIAQFQFHKALCQAAGQTGPLHKCDIYNSKEAGRLLRSMLSLGSSKPWPDAMEKITGQRNLDASALVEYFKPLQDWLKKQINETELGWEEGNCTHVTHGDEARAWLRQYDQEAGVAFNKQVEADWRYSTNITDETQNNRTKADIEQSAFQKKKANEAQQFDWKNFKDEYLRRTFFLITNIGVSALKDVNQIKELSDVKSNMESIYGKGRVCLSSAKCLSLEPDVYDLLAHSRNYTTLSLVWKGWRDQTGKKMRENYKQYVKLSNQAVRELGYQDTGEYWRSSYESETFQTDIERLLQQLQPLYQNLHTYVRRELMAIYGNDKFPASGHIPAHLLGNMWAQSWNNIYDIVVPFKNKQSIDITATLQEKGFNARMMFRTAEEFFTSLGLEPMPQNFWDNSMIVRPEGREVVCHASAWDFYNARDYRIRMCTVVSMESLIVIHHEMGHIQYFLQYRNQSVVHRGGANPGFHEAVGDVISLSVSTPKHLRKIGLLDEGPDDEENDINFLMKMALEKIAFLPFGYLIDQWRWSVFSGETSDKDYNKKWWDLRCKYQGVSPPLKRTEEDFDPGAKYHVAADYPYIRYFVSYVIQFQFHKALCKAANQTGPLHKCDIYRSRKAGKLLSDMLKLGSSKSWPEAMEIMTGQRSMDVQPLLEYFDPLIKWLKQENYRERPGWTEACPVIDDSPCDPDQTQPKKICTTNGSRSRYKDVYHFSVIFVIVLLVMA
ncbi:hypothetical protein CHS0354_019648 [Potamilus streckersoni]|uniref:Angiotensin-converting enzyme n=1 Tax=Potamilus streckersoni TaxID=2493646 RepID=A0AAE0W9E6_9BIVA|nr:hypothetical protein CHS0354_019648 [Potamilus streckersoni]